MNLYMLLQPAGPPQGIDFWALLMRISPISKGVLLLLVLFSIASWAIIIAKLLLWWRVRRADPQFLRMFHRMDDPDRIHQEAGRLDQSGYALLYSDLFENRKAWMQTDVDFRDLRTVMADVIERSIHDILDPLERQLGFLATTAGAAPFIGLFGTVVGIIAAFEAIGQYRAADLSVVAPGIAEALVATAAGLAAAIPALIGYNYFVQKNRKYRQELRDFGTYVLERWTFQRQVVAEKEPTIPVVRSRVE